MNLEFVGAAKVCWILGLLLIMISALGAVVTGGNGGAPLVLVGVVLIGVAFVLRKKTNG